MQTQITDESPWRKHRTLILSILLLIGSLAVMVLAESVFSYNMRIQSAMATVEDLGRLLEHQTASVIEKPDLVMRHIVEEVESNHRPKDWNVFLKKMLAGVPEAARFQLIDADGNYYAASYTPVPILNVGDREYFQAQKNNPDLGLVISKPLQSRSVPGWVLVLSRRINDAHGRFAGVVIASISLDSLQRFYSTLNIGPSGLVSLWNSERVNLTRHPFDETRIGQQITPPPELAEILSSGKPSGSYRARSRIDQIPRVFHYRKISGLPLAVIVGVGEPDILWSWKIKIAAYLLFTLISSGIAFQLLRRYIRATELVEAQRIQVAQSAKMSSLGVMAAGLAHEVNNPLTVIRGHALYLQDLAATRDDAEGTMLDSARTIVHTVDRISRIIRGLRSFSRDSGMDAKEWVPLHAVIDNTLALCQQRFKNHGIELRFGKMPECALYCREAQISEVLVNLLTNAFDAAETVLEPAEKWVEIRAEMQVGHCLISVSDSGPGIPPELADQIMLPFFTTKAVGKGTGLGLSIAKAIIEAHEGNLVFDREAPCTRFVISIPGRLERVAA